MAGFVTNLIQNSVSGLVAGATTTVGGYAGSAVNGVGNLIEGGGRAIGDGYIAKSFEGVGNSINAYGTSIRNATAPNTSSYGATKKIDATSKPGGRSGAQKALPSASGQKTLPTAKSTKASPSPAEKQAGPKAAEKVKSSYQSSSGAYKSTGSSYQAPGGKDLGPVKQSGSTTPKTLPPGKVSISSASLPKPTLPAAVRASTLNIPAAKSPKPAIQGFGIGNASKTSNKAGIVAEGQQRYQHLPHLGLGDSKSSVKGPSRAPTAVGSNNKSAPSMAPSKAGSVAGGPKFF